MICVSNKIYNFIINNLELNELKKEKIKYGIEGIVLTLSKLFIIITISLLINNLKNTLIFLLFYTPLRTVGFGLHFQKSKDCWIFSFIAFLLLPLLVNVIIFNQLTILILILCSGTLYLFFAPADTIKRPLIKKSKRIFNKIFITSILVIYIILINHLNLLISNLMLFASILQAILVLPITYKVFGQKYNNYKNFSYD